MRVVVQRVVKGSVRVKEEVVSSIGQGIVCLCGISKKDTEEDLRWMAKKLLSLRLWSAGDVNWAKSVTQQGFSVLLVSQFTLYASLTKGSKPDFHNAGARKDARELYGKFVEIVRTLYNPDQVKDGAFGEMMTVDITNDGPVTFNLTTDDREFVAKTVFQETKAKVSCSPPVRAGIPVGGDPLLVAMQRLRKKLDEIDALKKLQRNGKKLNGEQVSKIETEKAVVTELGGIERELNESRMM